MTGGGIQTLSELRGSPPWHRGLAACAHAGDRDRTCNKERLLPLLLLLLILPLSGVSDEVRERFFSTARYSPTERKKQRKKKQKLTDVFLGIVWGKTEQEEDRAKARERQDGVRQGCGSSRECQRMCKEKDRMKLNGDRQNVLEKRTHSSTDEAKEEQRSTRGKEREAHGSNHIYGEVQTRTWTQLVLNDPSLYDAGGSASSPSSLGRPASD